LEESATWDNQGASLQLDYQWNTNINTNINLAYSDYSEYQTINSTLVRTITRIPSRPRPGELPIMLPEVKFDLTKWY